MLSIFITFIALIFDVNAVAGTESDKHFQILTKYAEVEKKAVEYAKWTGTYRGKVKRWGSNLVRVTNICDCTNKVRINFCRKALHVDHFGLEFDLDHYPYLPCEQQEFWTKSPTPFEAQPFQVDMFLCPQTTYKDMETDKKVFLPYIYAASRGKSHDEVFTFVQKKTSNTKYPFQYIKNINFEKLEERNTLAGITLSEPLIRHSFSSTSLENLLGLQFYGEKKYRIYEKFVNKFSSLNVCGLRQKYKIHICRQHFQTIWVGNRSLLMVEGYSGRCRRRPIYLRTKNGLGLNKGLSVVLCPHNNQDDRKKDNVRKSYLYYISSNVFKYSTTLFHRQNMTGVKLQHFRSYNNQIDIAAVMRDMQRDRFIPYPSEEERRSRARQRSFDEILSEMNLLQQSSIGRQWFEMEAYKIWKMEKRFYDLRSIKKLQAARVAEELLILFSKIKNTTQVYTRFMVTYLSVDFYKLSDKGRQNICGQISPIMDSNEGRAERRFARLKVDWYHRRQVFFTVHEIEYLETDNFSMWECRFMPDSSNHRYFVGKTHLRNAAVLYRSSFIEDTEKYVGNEVYPHRVITNIIETVSHSSGSFTEPQA